MNWLKSAHYGRTLQIQCAYLFIDDLTLAELKCQLFAESLFNDLGLIFHSTVFILHLRFPDGEAAVWQSDWQAH